LQSLDGIKQEVGIRGAKIQVLARQLERAKHDQDLLEDAHNQETSMLRAQLQKRGDLVHRLMARFAFGMPAQYAVL
jgi:hypothetical protein